MVLASEGPMLLPNVAGDEAKEHNQLGIASWNTGLYEEAFLHFLATSKVNASVAEVYFNIAISLDKIGKTGDAIAHFWIARDLAEEGSPLLDSPILNTYLEGITD
jgi:tetratricopeptide (TPR) repeat protein